MINQIKQKIKNKESLTNEEVKFFLIYITSKIRTELNIKECVEWKVDKETSEELMLCNEASMKVRKFMNDYGLEDYCVDIKTHNLINNNLHHCSNIVAFNVEGNITPYLIDLTYSQFFRDDYPLNQNVVISVPDAINCTDREVFVDLLRQQGYIQIDDEILKIYLDIFLDTCKNKMIIDENNKRYELIDDEIIDEIEVYSNVYFVLMSSEVKLPIENKKLYEKIMINLNLSKSHNFSDRKERIELLTRFRDDIIEIIKSKQTDGELQQSSKTL